MSEHVIVYITFPNAEQAEDMAARLVEKKLIACANIMPAHTAIYEWEGKISQEKEVLMLAKTRKDSFEAVKRFVEERHSYELPCVISVDISDANKEFLNWIDKTVK